MGDNEYLTQVMIHERLREARARAARDRLLHHQVGHGAPGTGRRLRPRPSALRVYGAVAISLISRWRNWRPA